MSLPYQPSQALRDVQPPLPQYILHWLAAEQLFCIGDVARTPDKSLLQIPGIGIKGVERLRQYAPYCTTNSEQD